MNRNTITASKWDYLNASSAEIDPETDFQSTIPNKLTAERPVLIAIGGHTGTGKSTLGFALKNKLSNDGGILVIEDDAMRRKIVGVDLKTKMRPSDYCDYISRKTATALAETTKETLRNKQVVINCSGFYSAKSREEVENIAKEMGAQFIGIWLVAPRDVMSRRLKKRCWERENLPALSLEAGHASDADEGVIDKFGDIGRPSSPAWHILDASCDAEDLLERARTVITKSLLI